MSKSSFKNLTKRTKNILKMIAIKYSPTILASSMGAEDMVLTDMIFRNNLKIDIFILETGRLHIETIDMIQRIKKIYNYVITPFRPEPLAIANYIAQYGLDGIYNSVELRKECCRIRKIEPLSRAIAGNRSWITGQRRSQSITRAALKVQEHDLTHNIIKFNPLVNWSEKNIWQYIHTYKVPYNPLHDHGYSSIGCAPCTRSIQSGEDIRAGRWWWENPQSKECGLHLINGKFRPIKSK